MNDMKTNQGQEELNLDLGKLLMHYLTNWLPILIGGLVFAVFAFFITTFFITPKYQASVTVYVNNSMGYQSVTEVSSQGLATAQRLVNTYVNILQSDTVLNDVIQEGKLQFTPQGIRNMMTAKQVSNTEMFTVTIAYTDPEVAARIANTIAEVAPKRISSFVEGSSTKIVDYAKVPAFPFTPNRMKNTVLGGFVGCVLIGILLTLQYLFDMRVKTEEDITSYFHIPVLGTIPEVTEKNDKRKDGMRA